MNWNVALLAGALVLGVSLSACQVPGEVVAVKKSSVCPTCKDETRKSPLRGITYEKHICPTCKTLHVSDDHRVKPHVYCDSCKAAIEECPQCRGE